MSRNLYVSIKEYHEFAKGARTGVMPPQNFEDLCARIVSSRQRGLWQISQINRKTGETELELWGENDFTDNGATVALNAVMGPSTYTGTPGNIIAIDKTLASTTLQAALTSGNVITSINVAALSAAVANGAQMVVGAGGGSTMTVTINNAGGYASGYSGNVTINSITVNANYAIGANIKMVPSLVDPGSLSGASYTASLPSGQFTSVSGSGKGNRFKQVTTDTNYNFSTLANSNPSTTPTGNYTGAFLCNANPVASAANTLARIAFDAPMAVNSTFDAKVVIKEFI